MEGVSEGARDAARDPDPTRRGDSAVVGGTSVQPKRVVSTAVSERPVRAGGGDEGGVWGFSTSVASSEIVGTGNAKAEIVDRRELSWVDVCREGLGSIILLPLFYFVDINLPKDA